MRAQNITKSSGTRTKPPLRYGAVAVLIALALPGTAVAMPMDPPPRAADRGSCFRDSRARPARRCARRARRPTRNTRRGSGVPGLATEARESWDTLDPPATSLAADGFDWARATAGAGAMAALAALAGAALLTVRRRAAVSPSA